MQSKNFKNWENKGWEAMQEILDQEMPTKEKKSKRRFFFWWQAAGFALVIGAVFFIFPFSNDEVNNLQIVDNSDLSTSADFSENDANSATEKTITINQKSLTKKTTQTTDNQLIKTNKNTSSKAHNVTDFSLLKTEKNHRSTPQSTTANVDNSTIVNSLKNELKPLQTIQNPSVTVLTKEMIEFEKLPSIKTLLSLSIFELIQAPSPANAQAKKIKPVSKKLRPEYSIAANTTVNTKPNVNGYEARTLINFPFKNSKFSIQTGLNYRVAYHKELKQNWSSFNSNNNDSAFSDQEDVLGLDNNSSNPSGEYFLNQKNNQIESSENQVYHFLSVPTTLRYRLNSKWTVSAGAETSLLLNFLNRSPEANSLERSSVSPTSSPGFESTPFDLKNLDFGATAGISFSPAARWQLQLSYHHGNLFQQDAWQVNNRFFRLGAAFSLNNK